MDKLNRLMRLPEKIPCDKRIHALVGAFLAMVMLIALPMFLHSSFVILATLSIIVITAWSIEIYQLETKSGQYDNYDALAVVAGGMLVLLPYIIQGLMK